MCRRRGRGTNGLPVVSKDQAVKKSKPVAGAKSRPASKQSDLFARSSATAKTRGGKAASKSRSDYGAHHIEVLEGLEPVRRRPGMYVGGTDERALHHLAAEVLDNAMDEAVAGHANRIEVTELVEGAHAGVKARDRVGGGELLIRADNVVNATGVWADRVRPEAL